MNESKEMYLEVIYRLSKEKENVRAIDIAKKLNYSKPSVSKAMRILKTTDYININEKENILLTNKGLKKAREIYKKHTVIKDFLIRLLDLNEEEAEINACKIEHIITDDCFNKIKNYFKE